MFSNEEKTVSLRKVILGNESGERGGFGGNVKLVEKGVNKDYAVGKVIFGFYRDEKEDSCGLEKVGENEEFFTVDKVNYGGSEGANDESGKTKGNPEKGNGNCRARFFEEAEEEEVGDDSYGGDRRGLGDPEADEVFVFKKWGLGE